jgi:hypothetical protein
MSGFELGGHGRYIFFAPVKNIAAVVIVDQTLRGRS